MEPSPPERRGELIHTHTAARAACKMHPHTRAVVLLSTQLRPCQLSALTPPSTCRRKSPRRHFRLQHALTPQLGQLLEGGAKLAREHRLPVRQLDV